MNAMGMDRAGHEKVTPEEYFEHAVRWDDDMRIRTRRSAKIAWTVAGVSVLMAVVAISTLAVLMPMKTIEPFVVRVNDVTGMVDIVRPLNRDEAPADEAVSRYFIWDYIKAREEWLAATAPAAYRKVALMSARGLQDAWADYMSPKNPNGPQQQLGQQGSAKISLKTISFLQDNVASVRFSKLVHFGDERPDEATDWLTTVTFAFHPEAEMSDSDRMANPFGFLVEDVRTEREPSGSAN